MEHLPSEELENGAVTENGLSLVVDQLVELQLVVELVFADLEVTSIA